MQVQLAGVQAVQGVLLLGGGSAGGGGLAGALGSTLTVQVRRGRGPCGPAATALALQCGRSALLLFTIILNKFLQLPQREGVQRIQWYFDFCVVVVFSRRQCVLNDVQHVLHAIRRELVDLRDQSLLFLKGQGVVGCILGLLQPLDDLVLADLTLQCANLVLHGLHHALHFHQLVRAATVHDGRQVAHRHRTHPAETLPRTRTAAALAAQRGPRSLVLLPRTGAHASDLLVAGFYGQNRGGGVRAGACELRGQHTVTIFKAARHLARRDVHGVVALRVEGNRVAKHQAHVFRKGLGGVIQRAFDTLPNCGEVHGRADDQGIVGDVEAHVVHGLEEPRRVGLFAHLLQQFGALLQGKGQSMSAVAAAVLAHQRHRGGLLRGGLGLLQREGCRFYLGCCCGLGY
mmetsp:Transcript_2331/g.3890  ORF Transcript_2331/g.3890 Transcript_2331/m.3890 type:complete len:402 (-) Transcript_2331:902-2107(-)